jgi:hypothetical protein
MIMPHIPDLFISPHAVEQFQKRIASMDEAKARQMILAGICQATNVRMLPDGMTLRVRTQHPFPFEFRAYCMFDMERGHLVVTTVVRGDSNITRKHKRRAPREAERDQQSS